MSGTVTKFYTGVGSRETPDTICKIMTTTAKWLELHGYTLRSGGAIGADYAFEIGSSKPIIYSISTTHKPKSGKPSVVPCLEAYRDLAKLCCLHYKHMNSQYARDLHTRNICQVIGHDPSVIIKSDFLICYTAGGGYVGGTTTAIRCAERFDVPIFNFGNYDLEDIDFIKKELAKFLKEHMK